MPIYFVCLMGVGIVFVGLGCIILICMLMSYIVRSMEKNEATAPAVNTAAVQNVPELSPEKRREMIAAVSCAVAEELGADVSAIRIKSFKRI